MNKLLILVLAAVIGVVVGAVLFVFFNIFFLPLLQQIQTQLQPAITQIYQTWISIPEMGRTIILTAIPTVFALFFAWTKMRAINKLQQTQLEASQQILQISGEANQEIGGQQVKIDQLKTELNTLRSNNPSAGMFSQLNATIESKDKQIESLQARMLQTERLFSAIKQPTEDELVKRVNQLGYTVTKTVE